MMPINNKNKTKIEDIIASSSIRRLPPSRIPDIAASSFSQSSSSSSTPYDIFLSFRGEDTRKNFISHLFRALKHQGYCVFHDSVLKRGQLVSSGLLTAIEESKLSIIIFSRNYADSRWCLDELVKIMDCWRSSQHIVLPVFYDVEPSDVRNQTGHYAAAFIKHKQIHQTGQVNKWKAALNQAGNLSGLHLQNDSNGDEANFIDEIVKKVADSLDQPYLHVADYPVGIESHVQNLKGLLSLGTDDVRLVTIWGLGGIGKTTIAKAIFNEIYNIFQGSCFLADVRETAKRPDGLITLQDRLISDVLKERVPKIHNWHHGIEVIKQKLWCRKVLIILDDVDSLSQLENLAINLAQLAQGSRVIVTTRDKSCVTSLDSKLYEPKPLDESNSLKLFKWYAFGDDYPEEVYKVLSKKVVDYAGGLPLVLKTLGPYMRSLSSVDEWQKALERLRIIPPDDVQEKLKLSFDSLAVREKELFLDIVGFFVGVHKDFMFKVLADKTRGYYPEFEFKVLLNRCLVKIDMDGLLWMHDMLKDIGRTIVHEESFNNPEKRLRLWYPENALYVLESLGIEAIESIIIEFPDSNEEFMDINTFEKMKKLRLIHFRHLNLIGTYSSMRSLDKLKWLSWYGFPLACIPCKMDMQNLVALHLQKSRLRQLWKGTKVLSKLKFLDVSDSFFLTSTPDFSGVLNLEELCLCNCKNLVEVHHSIGRLHKLVLLDFSGCSKLFKAAEFEVSFSNLWHLFSTILSRESLKVSFSYVWDLFSSMSSRKSLLRSRDSNFLSASFVQWPSCLMELQLSYCNLRHLPVEIESLVSLEHLILNGNKFSSIAAGIRNLHRLQFLRVSDCSELKSIFDLPNDLFVLAADGCQSLETVQIVSKRLREPLIAVSEGTKLIDNMFTSKKQMQALPRINIFTASKESRIPRWFNFQGLGPFLSFVVPLHPNRSIEGWIVGVSNPEGKVEITDYVVGNVYNKTMEMMYTIPMNPLNQTTTPIMYVEFSKYGIVVEGGDEIEILFVGTSLVKGCGLYLVYNEDEDVEMDERLVIQYSPDVNLYDDEDDMNPMQYVSPVMMARINPMLHDLKHFDHEALLALVKEIAAGGDVRNEHRQVYRIIANAFYSWYVQSSLLFGNIGGGDERAGFGSMIS